MTTLTIINQTDTHYDGLGLIQNSPIAILSGQVDQTSLDLSLPGSGVVGWAKYIDQNFLRLVESFSCRAKETGDFLPGGPPNNTSYDILLHQTMPKSEEDLGVGRGINHKTHGQLWFNTTNLKLYIFDGSQWAIVGNTQVGTIQPVSKNVGDVWYDLADNQLKVWTGTAWVSVAANYAKLDGTSTLTGSLNSGGYTIVNVGTPVNPTDATSMGWVSSNFLALTGGSLSGTLSVSGAVLMLSTLTVTSTLTVQSQPVSGSSGNNMVGNRTYNDSRYLQLNSNNTLSSSSVMSFGTHTIVNESGGSSSSGSNIRFTNTNAVISSNDTMMLVVDADNNSVGSLVIGKGSNTSSATPLLTIATTGKVTSNVVNYETLVTANNDLTNKKYVDNAITTATASLGGSVKFWTYLSGTAAAGDIASVSGIIYINLYAGNNWKKVWPATYS